MENNLKSSKYAIIETCFIILGCAIKDVATLLLFNTKMTLTVLNALLARVNAINKVVGSGTKTDQKESTLAFNTLSDSLKEQFDEAVDLLNHLIDSPERCALVISNLKLSDYKKSKKKMTETVNGFLNNIADYQAEMIAAGYSKTMITKLTTDATQYRSILSNQNTNLTQSIVLTAEQNTELYEIDTLVRKVAQLGQIAFRKDKEKKLQYDYNKILDRFKGTQKKKKNEVVTPETSNQLGN